MKNLGVPKANQCTNFDMKSGLQVKDTDFNGIKSNVTDFSGVNLILQISVT